MIKVDLSKWDKFEKYFRVASEIWDPISSQSMIGNTETIYERRFLKLEYSS